jgi:protein-disulfide isomerase
MTDEQQQADATGAADTDPEPGTTDPSTGSVAGDPDPSASVELAAEATTPEPGPDAGAEPAALPEPGAESGTATEVAGDAATPEPGADAGAEAETAASEAGAEADTAAAASPPESAGPGSTRRSVPPALGYLGAAILGIVIGAGGLALATGGVGASAEPTPAPSPSAEPSSPPAGNAVGDPDAPVTIEVWADYQCPFCRLEDLLFGGAIEREYVMDGLVRVVYRDFAFLGQESSDAAVAVRCAGRQDPAAQLRFHDTLYTFQQGENQGRFVRENLVQMAEIAGVPDAAAFETCLDDPAVAAEVQDETQEGRDVGIDSTPTMRLSGPGGERVLRGFSQTWPTIRDAIEEVLVPAPSPDPSASPAGSPTIEPSPTVEPSPSGEPAASPSPAG